MTGSNDTQEEKPQPDGTILPSCLNLTVHRKEQGHKRDKDLKDNVMLYCTKVPKVEDAEEEPRCPRYSCMSGPIQRNCSTINFIQTYNTVQCHKEGQKPRKRHKCWAKGDKNHGNIDLCCLPEVLENVTLKEPEEEPSDLVSLQHPEKRNTEKNILEPKNNEGTDRGQKSTPNNNLGFEEKH